MSKCLYKNCTNSVSNTSNLSFFRFPKDPVRSALWVDYCGRKDLKNKTVEYLHIQGKICEEHFDDDMFRNEIKNRLRNCAYPRIYNKRREEKKDSKFITLENKFQTKLHEVYIIEPELEVAEEVTDNVNSLCNVMNEINDETEMKKESTEKVATNNLNIVFKDVNEIINGVKTNDITNPTKLSTTYS